MGNTTPSKPRIRYDNNDLEKLKSALQAGAQKFQPKSHTNSMRDLFSSLQDDIQAMRGRGYTVSTIAEMIYSGGFQEIAPSTLRRYVSAVSGRKRRRKRRVTPPTSATPSPTQSDPTQSSATPAPGAAFDVPPDREDL